jgi:hypothetical protein
MSQSYKKNSPTLGYGIFEINLPGSKLIDIYQLIKIPSTSKK